MTSKELNISTSTPSLTQFNPHDVPWQYEVLNDVEHFDYSLGKHELLFSGSIGSAKSLLGAHIALTHCLKFKGSRVCLGRRAMPDLKDTIYKKIHEHIGDDLKEGQDYFPNETRAQIFFKNGSEIISRSWADKKTKKGRSLELSMLIIEESAENDDLEEKNAIEELSMRVGRLSHVPQNLVIHMTNPDSPGHWLYKHFIESKSQTRHTYYSLTKDNKFLPGWYIEQLEKDLDPKMVRRMLYGEWIEISGEVVYYEYNKDIHFRDYNYKIDLNHPIWFSYDFNIGEGKPMSVIFFQHIDGVFHFFDEVVCHGSRTANTLDEMAGMGLLEHDTLYICTGDASGGFRTTNSVRSNYDIIKEFMSNYKKKVASKLNSSSEFQEPTPQCTSDTILLMLILEMLGVRLDPMYTKELELLMKDLDLQSLKVVEDILKMTQKNISTSQQQQDTARWLH